MKTAKTAKVLLAIGAAVGAGALLWPRTADFRAHIFEARAQSTEAPKSEGAPQGRAGGGQNRPAVNVRTSTAERGPMPFVTEAVGTVQPIASVAIRSRIDAQIDNVLVPDGAPVKAGDVLVRLDSRQIEAQIKQAEAQLAKDRTVLEQAERDVGRYSELVAKQTGTQVNLDNARTSAASARAAILGDQAQVENLNVQLSWYTIKAPISGRVSAFSLKAGNIVRSGDSTATGTLTTIVQTTPIYVAFSVPQRLLTDVREAVLRPDAEVVVTPQGSSRSVKGRVAVIDNAIDPATGTVMVRATFENADELLWAGQLCQVRVTLRVDPEVVSLPREAVQTGQNGNYVYVIEDSVAKVRPVELGRSQDGRDIVTSGLKGGEVVVTDGALALTNGAKVDTRSAEAKKGNS
ncbi:MAG: family efflux transporter, subunit [Hyphomicrobiales bacterium]|nr:family efflux transporter, subunit [Hyphomicrobiales bacterium]